MSKVFSLYAFSEQYGVFYCFDCGNFMTVPVPAEHILQEIYNKTYHYDVHSIISVEKNWRSTTLMDYLTKAGELGGLKNVLEIGCMHGDFLGVMKNYGAQSITGVEPDKTAAENAKKAGDFHIHNMSVDEFLNSDMAKGCCFDLIVMSHVLEHLPNPNETLDRLRLLLGRQGQLLILVPNAGALAPRVFRGAWGWWQTPVHLFHYTLDGLRRTLKNHKFEIKVAMVRGADSLCILLSIRNLLSIVTPFLKCWQCEKNSVFLTKIILRIWSAVFRYSLFLGDEEMVILCCKGN
jgi:2-polyprenyl-3-methyl-5-hydroxy-6-metoxy-1,4-benzoquinol methylase